MAVPIWKDYYFTVSLTEAEFRVRTDSSSGAIIYTGKAYARPSESSLRIKVNDICADYIRRTLPVLGVPFNSSVYTDTFYVEYLSLGTWKSAGTVTFDYDWSYDYGFLASRDGLSFPVRAVVDTRQYLVRSLVTSGSTASASVTNKSGQTSSVSVDVKRPSDFDTDYDERYAIFEQMPSPTAILDISTLTNPLKVVIDGETYTVDDSLCKDFCLYYVNAHGGWDSLLIDGRVSKSDTYTRHDARVDYDNSHPSARGTRNDVNEIERRYTLQTGWMNDQQSARMHHLLGSTMVYLHDLVEDIIMPVTIANSDAPYKTYKGEGNRLVNYTIEAVLSQEMTRR